MNKPVGDALDDQRIHAIDQPFAGFAWRVIDLHELRILGRNQSVGPRISGNCTTLQNLYVSCELEGVIARDLRRLARRRLDIDDAPVLVDNVDNSANLICLKSRFPLRSG
jgi:hypothetical protein